MDDSGDDDRIGIGDWDWSRPQIGPKIATPLPPADWYETACLLVIGGGAVGGAYWLWPSYESWMLIFFALAFLAIAIGTSKLGRSRLW